MRTFKKIVNFMFSRLFMVAMMLLAQICLLLILVFAFSQVGFYTYLFLNLISLLVVLFIINNNEHPSYKITWIISILSFPIVGGVFYLVLGNKRLSEAMLEQSSQAIEETKQHMPANHLCDHALMKASPSLGLQSRYIYNMSGNPLWEDVDSMYFPLGELMFERMMLEMEQAEKYIFLEYFIVKPGVMWNRIFELLKRKVAQGVEVRFMYDDIGSIRTLPKGYDRIIREAGIKLCVFNPFRPRINMIYNNRDHRKILVIDGKTAFCGGINIADEYINAVDRFGHWKDTGIMIKGPAVWSFAFMFLQLWKFATGEDIDYNAYRAPATPYLPTPKGLVQVFGDSPLDRVNVTETAYRNIISRSTQYVYITSPYLVINYEMESVLCAAAESGIDVRIMTPYHYDKWYVHVLTRSHYARLIRSGVRIFEYTPGFIHGKTFVSDDEICMVGTCNMDYRSFYLHFECSASFYGSDTVMAVKQDFLECQKQCHEYTLEEVEKVPLHIRALRAVLKVFAPLI